MRTIVGGATRQVARLLSRAAPRFSAAFGSMLTEEADTVSGRSPAVPFTVAGASFTLSLGNETAAWADYRRLGAKGLPYEPIMLACLTRLLKRSTAPRFIDIGSYLGYYACYVSAALGGKETVWAVESNPDYAASIRASARMNGFERLKVFEAALSDRVESVRIDGLTVRHDGAGTGGTTTVTLDDLCAREGFWPTIVKLDVHGAEGKIVLGARRTLAEAEVVLLEMHHLPLLRLYSPGVTRSTMLDAIEEAGLTLYYVAGHSGPRRFMPAFEEMLSGHGYTYRPLDRKSRDLLLFDRSHDEFVLALRGDVQALLGPSVVPENA